MTMLTCPSCWRSFGFQMDALVAFPCPNCSAILQLSVVKVEENALPATLFHQSREETATLPPGSVTTASRGPVTPGHISGYQIVDELGRGGMGVVYKARHLKLNREVALKMILSGEHAGDEERDRFGREAEAIARLQHPGIVQVFEIGEHEGKPFFALEYCDGGSLERKLAGTPLKPVEAASLVEKLARAMQAAHEARVIHRDLKPANVLLSLDGTPKITDFGLAKKLDEQGQTRTGQVMGTPSYMAPEQAEGRKDIGPSCDIYALGAILYECLTGRPPFRAATSLDTIMQVLSEEPVPPRQLNANVPRDLQTICLKCLQKDPARRYASAEDLAADLGRFLQGEPIEARSLNVFDRLARSLERSAYDADFHAYANGMFWLAGIVGGVHLLKQILLAYECPGWLLMCADGVAVTLAGLVLWWYRFRVKGFLPTSFSERLLWSICGGFLITLCLDFVVCGYLMTPEQLSRGDVYPHHCLLAGMMFWILGSSYWGRFYAVAVAFFLLAFVLLIDPRASTLAFGGLWTLTLTLAGLHLRRLSLAPGSANPPGALTPRH